MSQAIVIDRASNSAARLAEALDVFRVRPERVHRTRHRRYINWGCTSPISLRRPGIILLNKPEAIRRAVRKVDAFRAVGDLCPEWSTIPARHGPITLARRDGLSCGRGITIIRDNDPIPPHYDFYVQYIRKSAEYRVHVAFGQVIFLQQKRRRNATEQTRDQQLIRNHENGWVFCQHSVSVTPELKAKLYDVALACVSRLGLDFGAVDLVVEKRTGRVYFLEVNTRPGLESTGAIEAYRNALSI